MQTLFTISAVGIAAMIVVRLIEMRYERMLGLSHLSAYLERKLRPHAKRFEDAVAERSERISRKVSRIPDELRRLSSNAAHVAEKYSAEAKARIRGQRPLQRGSVSFFLLNIADHSVWIKTPEEHAEVEKPKLDEFENIV